MAMWRQLINRLFRPRNTTAATPASWFVEWSRGDASNDAGVSVNGITALKWAPFWYGVNKIAGHVAQMPLELREKIGDASRLANKHAAYWLLNYQPNAMMTPSIFREVMQHHALVWGNGRAAIVRNDRRETAL